MRRTRDMPGNAVLLFSEIERKDRKRSMVSVVVPRVENVQESHKPEGVGKCTTNSFFSVLSDFLHLKIPSAK